MSDGPSTQRRYSEDGSHWWDGSAWQPVQSTPTPSPTAARDRRRSPVTLLVVVALVALIAGRITGSSVAAASTTPVDVSGPPRISDGFPDAGQRYLTDMTVAKVTEDWLGKGGVWTCEEGPVAPMGAAHEMECSPRDEDAAWVFDVRVSYDGDDEVTTASANCELGPDAKACSELFSELCDVVFSGDAGTAKKAKRWVRRNMDSDRPAVFDRVHVWMPLNGSSASIYMQAAG